MPKKKTATLAGLERAFYDLEQRVGIIAERLENDRMRANGEMGPKAMVVNIERAFKRIEALEKRDEEDKQELPKPISLGVYLVTYQQEGVVKRKVVESYGYGNSVDGTMVEFDPACPVFSIVKDCLISIELLED